MQLTEAAGRIDARLIGNNAEFCGCSTDSRTISKGELFIALHGERYDGHEFIHTANSRGAVAALVDNKTEEDALPLLQVKDTQNAMMKLAADWRSRFDIPLVAVTGSNGKTTVKEMISTILGLQANVLSTRGNLNNEIGVPLTLYRLGNEHAFAVLEMGASGPGEIARLSGISKPTVALITQCAPAHLQGFGSIEGVARAKAEIYSGLSSDGVAIINADDDYAGFWINVSADHHRITFGIHNQADVSACAISFDAENVRTRFTLNTGQGSVDIEMPLVGRHNVMNALAAAAACIAMGMSLQIIREGLHKLTNIAGRLQLKHGIHNIRILDDTYNANPVSLGAGLEVLSLYPGRRWLVLGDMAELGADSEMIHRQAGESARQRGVERLYAVGEMSSFSVRGFGEGARHFPDIDSLLQAIKPAMQGDVTVLVKGSRSMAMETVVNSLVHGG